VAVAAEAVVAALAEQPAAVVEAAAQAEMAAPSTQYRRCSATVHWGRVDLLAAYSEACSLQAREY